MFHEVGPVVDDPFAQLPFLLTEFTPFSFLKHKENKSFAKYFPT